MEALYPLKCWYLRTEPHRLISQKTEVWLLTCFQFPCYSFLTSFGIYFLIGVAYKRMIEGAKGLEQIPHQKFWKELGNLQAVCFHYRNLEMKLSSQILIFAFVLFVHEKPTKRYTRNNETELCICSDFTVTRLLLLEAGS